MNLRNEESRPSSSRPQSRINPITGEEMPFSARDCPPPSVRGGPPATIHKHSSSYSKHDRGDARRSPCSPPSKQNAASQAEQQRSHFKPNHRASSRPEGIPRLHLGKLCGPDDDPDITLHMDPYEYKLNSPGATSAVSWGPPSAANLSLGQAQKSERKEKPSARKGSASHQKQKMNWERENVIPENLPAPSQKYKDQYAQLGQDMRESYRHQSTHSITESEVERKIEELRLDIPQYVAPENDDDTDQLKKDWTEQPYSKAAQLRRDDKESLEDLNRKKKLLETVMIDQLSRPVISCPQESLLSSSRSQTYRPRARGTVRTQHDSSRISSAATPTEKLLSRRVQFEARVLTRCGRDAIRELTGFYFAVDNSITVYEFKQFGKGAKALPFVKRGTYEHLSGPRRGQKYTLSDIKQGECIILDTVDQPVPDSMKSNERAILKVTKVDDEAKATILFEGVPVRDQDDVWRRAHIPQTKEDVDAKLLQIRVQDCVRGQIRARGLKVYTGLYKRYSQLDDTGDGRLNRVELEKGLIDFHVEVPQEDFDDYWEVLDTGCTSFLEYDVFMRGYLGEMTEDRKTLVRKAFAKIDPAKKGEVAFDDVKKFYNAYKHPRVKSGECTEQDILENFLSHFHGGHSKSITFLEFEIYYEGLSVCVDSGENFSKILQNAWSI